MQIESVRAFRKKLGEAPLFGPFSKTSDPGMIEVLGHAGFDFVILDMEHGPNSVETVQGLVRSAENAGILPIVRVPAGDPVTISKVLDVGAAGVQVPQITSAAELKQALSAARFAPEGERGVCRYVRAANYSSTEKSHYFKQANEALLIIQLEGAEALKNLDEILDVPGPDAIFIGPYDLSQSLGVTGQVEHPKVLEKMQQIATACAAKGIAVGNFTENPEQTAFWVKKGLRYMSFSVDVGLMYEACQKTVASLKSACG